VNKQTDRTFIDIPAVRERVPLLAGLVGPSGSGKTYSALRLATGIQRVTGGEIFGIDTEARRMLAYADKFKFRHVEFGEPFGSLDYLAAMQHCVNRGAGVIVVDSLTHEHQGVGGYLMTWEDELDRIAGDDYAKRDRAKFVALQKSTSARKRLIDGMMQLNCNFVFCFRAREKVKPMKVDGKMKPVEMGFSPIGGEEFLYEMTVRCLLLPKSEGIPTWRSEFPGELEAVKLPGQFAGLFPEGRPLDEDTGQALAEWAKGDSPSRDYGGEAAAAAHKGSDEFRKFWGKIPKGERAKLQPRMDEFKRIAQAADTPDDPFDGPSNVAPDAPPPATASPEAASRPTGRAKTPPEKDARPEPSGGQQTPSGDDALLADLMATGKERAEQGRVVLEHWLDEDLSGQEQALMTPVRVRQLMDHAASHAGVQA